MSCIFGHKWEYYQEVDTRYNILKDVISCYGYGSTSREISESTMDVRICLRCNSKEIKNFKNNWEKTKLSKEDIRNIKLNKLGI